MSRNDSNRKDLLPWYRDYIKRIWRDEDPEVPYYYDYPLCVVYAKRIACAKHSSQAKNPFFQGLVTHSLLERYRAETDEVELQLLGMSWEIYYNRLCRNITTIAELEQVWPKTAYYLRWHCYQPGQLDILGYDQRLFVNRYRTLSIFRDFMCEWRRLINRSLEQTISIPWVESEEELTNTTDCDDMFDLSYAEVLYKRYKTRIDEVVSIVGRTVDEEASNNYLVSQMLHYQFPKPPYEDIDGITVGADLMNVIPSELPSLCSPDTDALFYQKYANRQLQSFSSFSKQESKTTSSVANMSHHDGPIIICIDTSGSMSGFPYDFGCLMIMRIYEMALRQNRAMFLVEFSVFARCLDLSGENGMDELCNFLCGRYVGGSDGEAMFEAVLEQLETENFRHADAVIISDFDFEFCTDSTLEHIHSAQANGTRFYGINPSHCDGNAKYESVMEKIWRFYK